LTSLVLFQTVLNILFMAFILLLWSRLRHLTGDEGRLKQGLQILQTKIAILEDLGRKVDEQASQLMQVLEHKRLTIESLLDNANNVMTQIENKTTLAAVDPETLVERENAIKFTKAAILANKGLRPNEIASRLKLGIQEAELIYSLNAQQLQFKLEELPGWMLPHIQNEIT